MTKNCCFDSQFCFAYQLIYERRLRVRFVHNAARKTIRDHVSLPCTPETWPLNHFPNLSIVSHTRAMKPEYVSDRRCSLGVAKRSEDNTKRETWVGERSKAEQRISFSSFHGQLTHGNSTPMRRFRLIHGQFHSYASRHASGVARRRRSRNRCALSGWLLELLTHIDIAAAVERENTCCDDIRWRLSLLLPFAQPAPSLCQISSVSWLLCWVCFASRKNLSISVSFAESNGFLRLASIFMNETGFVDTIDGVGCCRILGFHFSIANQRDKWLKFQLTIRNSLSSLVGRADANSILTPKAVLENLSTFPFPTLWQISSSRLSA